VSRDIEKNQPRAEKGDRHTVSRICGYYLIQVKIAYDWLKKWDGTWQSLKAKSHRPHHHPKEHTEEEISLVIEVMWEYKLSAVLLIWQELYNRGYTRSYGGLKRFL